ncbi:MAG: c-type cytochrome domain-containing protein [Gemmataceae bacterium]
MSRPGPDDIIDQTEPFPSGARLGWWGGYGALVLLAFCFGVWTGNQRPRPVEQAAAPAPVSPEKVTLPPPEANPESKKELTPEPKKAPEVKAPEPKKAPEVVPMPEPKKTPDVVVKAPEPKKTPEPPPPPMVKEVLFVKEVLPIFKSKCNICHGDSKGVKGDLDLRSLKTILKGGDNGPGVKPGDLKTGTVWQSIEDGTMPPAGKEALSDAEKTVIRNWILSGAK